MSFTSAIKAIQDIMRKDTGVDGDAQRIAQLVWMLFLKIFEDSESARELIEDNYQSPIPAEFRWSAWAGDTEGITGDKLSDFINNELFPALKELGGSAQEPRRFLVSEVFKDAYNYMKNGTLIRQVINQINDNLNFNKTTDRHALGDFYEKFLKDLQSAGNAGEYYTPRAVTEFMVDRAAPELGDKVLDPACGTGGFLASVVEFMKTSEGEKPEFWETLGRTIKGVEKKPLPHLLCVTNMLLHGLDTPTNVIHGNWLQKPLTDWSAEDKVDVIVTNPPFGGIEEDGTENNFPASVRTKETADLFLVLIMRLLKNGGRAAVVLPDGTLFGEGTKTRIKEMLLQDCNLHTVVRLPNSVFAPYTSIKTNLLFFDKGEPTKEVWFYEHPMPKGYKAYSKTRPMKFEEFAPEQAWWDNRQESEQAWKVEIKDIIERGYNLDIKNPNTVEDILKHPDKLLEDYQTQEATFQGLLSQLKDELTQALER